MAFLISTYSFHINSYLFTDLGSGVKVYSEFITTHIEIRAELDIETKVADLQCGDFEAIGYGDGFSPTQGSDEHHLRTFYIQ